jgi:hypothetical protein
VSRLKDFKLCDFKTNALCSLFFALSPAEKVGEEAIHNFSHEIMMMLEENWSTKALIN